MRESLSGWIFLFFRAWALGSCILYYFQPEVCNGCHDLIQKPISFNNVIIVAVKGNDCRIHFLYISKDEAIKMLKKPDLTENSRALENIRIYYHILKCIKKL